MKTLKYFDGMGRDITEEIIKLKQDNAFLNQEVEELTTATVSKLRRRNSDLKKQLKTSEEQITELTEKCTELEDEINNLNGELEKAKLANEEMVLEMKKLEEDLVERSKPVGKVLEIR